MRSNGNTQAGFGMIEVLVAMIILGIITSSAYYFMNGQNKVSINNTDVSKAMFLGKQGLDSLRMATYDKVVSDCDTVSDRYVRNWYVTTDVANKRKQVEMVVSWPLTKEHKATFNTVIADIRDLNE